MNKNILLAGVVVLVLGLATAIGVTLSSEPTPAGLPEGEVSIQGVNLSSFTDGPDEEIGSSAPSFSSWPRV